MEKNFGELVMQPKVLVPIGYGLNCEDETTYIYQLLGAKIDKVHINDLCEKPKIISNYHIIDFIGGFVDGDHIAAGKIHANRLKYSLGEELYKFIHEGKIIIGVCNGFQTLIKSGLLPGFDDDYQTQMMTLTYNNSGKFEDRWVHLVVNQNSKCIWMKGIKELYLPVRHGEGKVRVRDPSVLERLKRSGQIVLFYAKTEDKKPTMKYPYNPNGSDGAIAGICDPTGRVFGKMPHREAFWSPYNHPNWTRLKIDGTIPEGMGIQISRNGVEYAREHLI
jgi:phosphoribosylformylglycinamidine (FGAM) synthase-like amidotransferase family enzyme